MISASDTAYPLLSASPTSRELADVYTPDLFELKFAEERTREAGSRVALLVLLKTFRRLGYFVKFADVPASIIRHIAHAAGYETLPGGLDEYDESTVRVRQMALVRLWTGVSAFDRNALKIVIQSCVEASRVREDLADIINIAIEELIRKRYELPRFTTLFRAARTARATVNRSYYRRISEALDVPTKTRIDSLFDKPEGSRQTAWEWVKNEPGQPTVKGVRRFLENARWLKEQTFDSSAVSGIPAVKLQRFAAEGRALNAARMKEAKPDKGYAFAVALIRRQRARALDDAGDMLIRLVQRMQNTAREKLQLLQSAHLQRSANLVSKLRDVGLAYLSDAPVSLLEHLPLCPTSQDRSLVDAVAFVLANQNGRAVSLSTISASAQTPTLDLSFVGDLWWPLVTGVKTRTAPASIDRRLFEICVVVQVANDLKSGDLCIPESDKFRDYRTQLLSWEDVHPRLSNYGEQAGVAVEPKAFIAQLRNQLEDRSRITDDSFPENRHLRFENGEPILTPVEAVPDPEGLDQALSSIKGASGACRNS